MNASQAKTWLAQETRSPRFYFDDTASGVWFAGVGARRTLRIEAPATTASIATQLRAFCENAQHPVFGGLRFDPTQTGDSEWRRFGAAYFFEPAEFETGTDFAHRQPSGITEETSLPETSPAFRKLFDTAMSELRGERLQKLVLAQRYAEATVHDVWAFESEPNSFSFCFQPDDDVAFQGTSPELLFRQAGREVVCDALAGTRARGDDDAMKAALLNDQKDGEEHRLVVDYLHDQLSKLGEVHVGERTIRTTATLHHLFTPVAATVGAHASVLSQIHPTPALAGFPTQDAVQWLSRNEPFDRGWYGGTIGVINGDDACFAVAIRSALLTRDATFLYAGAGVVPMSDCDAEWREIENKRRAIAERFLRST